LLVTACPPLRHPEADPGLPPDPTTPWWLVQVHPLQERRLAEELIAAGVACYLPLGVFRKVRPTGRPWSRTSPLFPGYAFVRSDPRLHPALADSRRVARVRRIEDQARFVAELARLDAILVAPAELTLGPLIHAGTPVRVVGGSYSGLPDPRGVVTRLASRNRVHVNLTTLGQSVSVELDRSQVEPLP
jgi:transcription antitermination factor NusG